MAELNRSPLLVSPHAPRRPNGALGQERVAASRHFGTLLGKNSVLKRREWSATCCPWCPLAACCELVMPIAVLALLWWAKVQCNEGQGGQCKMPVLAGWGGDMPKDNHTTVCTEGLKLTDEVGDVGLGYSTCNAWTDHKIFSRPTPLLDVLAYLHWSDKRLALAVRSAHDKPKAERLRDWITTHWHPDMKMQDIPCVDLEQDVVSQFKKMTSGRRRRSADPSPLDPGDDDNSTLPCMHRLRNPGVLPGFANLTTERVYTADELEALLESPNYGDDVLYYGAVVFDSIGGDGTVGAPGDWSYSIRLNFTAETTPNTAFPKTRPLDPRLVMNEAHTYLRNGFVSLQLLINRYIIGNRTNISSSSDLLEANGIRLADNETPEVADVLAESCRYAPQALEAVPMPVGGVMIDGFYELVSVAFPLVFIVAFLYTQKTVINELIHEKETKVRESLRMLGVGSFAIIGSWYVTYALIFGVLCLIFTGIASVQIFPHSNAFLIFALFWLWCMSFLSFALFMHAFFDHSRTGGIVGMMVMFAQWILYGSQTKEGAPPSNVMIMLTLLPNAAFSAGLDMIAKFEAMQVGVTFENWAWPLNNSSFRLVLGMMCIDVAIWTVLGWYLDRVLPKEYGVRLPLHFLCLPSYWSGRSMEPARGAAVEAALEEGEDAAEDVPARAAGYGTVEGVPEAVRSRSRASGVLVRTLGLRREFSTPGGVKVAVAGLDLAMYEGQILALLGHNGAGKTTTIHMLTGMVAPSAGDAQVVGHSVITGMKEIRHIIGVCPQHDVLWLDLTVREHLNVYAKLRGLAPREVSHRSNEMMQEVGLTEKSSTRAGALSGGQRRKLSLCLALVGRPPVVFLDEPTSGMDPFSRRSTWNIIRGVRDGRVTVLTTHFMDEADILGDRIAILAEGTLQCCGSSLFLKNRFGAGYRITCSRKKEGLGVVVGGPTGEAIAAVIREHVREAELLTDVGAELSMRLPTTAAPHFPELFTALDARSEELGLEHYGLSMVTLEEVFLKVASGEMERLVGRSTSRLSGLSADADGAQHDETGRRDAADATTNGGADGLQAVTNGEAAAASGPVVASAEAPAAETNGRPLGSEARVALRHLGALFVKRARYGRRDFRSVGCTVLLPVVLLAGGLWLLDMVSNRQMPSMGLGLEEQFGHELNVPYSLPDGESWMDAVSSYGADLVAENVSKGEDHGNIFGRDYIAGLPTFKKCKEDAEPFPKCFRQNRLCTGAVVMLLQGLREAGLPITCNSTCADVKTALLDACADDARLCTERCMAQADGLSWPVCHRQCEDICQNAKNLTFQCDKLPPVTIGWICPVPCAGYSKDTCEPGTACSAPPNPHAADPSGTLSFQELLFQEGQTRKKRTDTRYGAVKSTRNASVGSTVTLLFNTSGVHSVPTFVNLVSSALKEATSGPGSSISASIHPMPLTDTEVVNKVVSAVVNLLSTFVIIIAFSWIPAAIVAYVVREREAHHNSKHQQLISGVSLLAYWTANLLWDLCMYAVPLGLSVFFIYILDISAFVRNGALWATFMTFLGYGLAVAPFSYLLSFLFSRHTTAQVICLVINFLTGLILMITSYILSAINNTKAVNNHLMWVYRIFPGFCLGHGLFEVCTNSIAATTFGLDESIDLLAWDVSGKDVFFLFIAAPVYFILTVVADYLMHSPLAAAGKHFDPSAANATAGLEEEDDDPDVVTEAERVASGAADGDVIRLVQLGKVYRTPEGRPKAAVRGLSFGLPRGECFGFLGINGAGKTSTLNMLTGAILPSSGTAYLGGHDIIMEQWQVRRLLGYCPQHDALLDRLTVREHLELFGRIKGLPRAVLRTYCDSMMDNLSLTPHVDKLAMTLSGGNKRKLSLAIALMGSPPLVLLDEPSTGVDPAARRLMWDVVSAVSTARRECSVMLTTHNMEEAEALCSRIGIMVGGRLRCIGTNQHLKALFGTGYQLEVRLADLHPTAGAEAARSWGLPERIELESLPALCTKLGKPGRAAAVTEGSEEGYPVLEVLLREGYMAAPAFGEWWLLEDRAENLGAFLGQRFPETAMLERHDRTLRFKLPANSPLAELFRLLESAKSQLALEEYGISQTTLEQIFNNFAAHQQEETQAIRGLFVMGRQVSRETVEENVELSPPASSNPGLASAPPR